MLNLKRPIFLSIQANSHRLLLSSATTWQSPSLSLSLQETIHQPTQTTLLSFLKNNPSDHKTVQQIHSHSLTSASLTNGITFFNALLRCYSLSQKPIKAFFIYNQLLQAHCLSSSCSPNLLFDSFTYSFLIKSCANLQHAVLGIQVHALTAKLGFGIHLYVQTALVDMYVVCGEMGDAYKLFVHMPDRNSVSWNVMITGLINWGELKKARALFEQMPCKTVVSWTGMIDGYTRMNKPDEAIGLFREMVIRDGIKPNELTVLTIFPALSSKGDLRMCKSVHGYGEKIGFYVFDIRVTNALVDAYAKCGCITSASMFFEEIRSDRKNLVSWTSMISAFASHGMGNEAVYSFDRMEKEGLKANRVTFLGVLHACSHGGLIEEGLNFFEKMVKEARIIPDSKHFGCLIDMLARVGRLEEAEKMALQIPNDTINVVIWRILLGACSFYNNIDMGERVTQKILALEKHYGGDYVLMSNIFSSAGRFSDAEKLRRSMEIMTALKVPGHSLA